MYYICIINKVHIHERYLEWQIYALFEAKTIWNQILDANSNFIRNSIRKQYSIAFKKHCFFGLVRWKSGKNDHIS